jgi:outer membrane biosynthesis protein TonB
MAIAGMSRGSLRTEQAEVSRLAWAFAISLAFHLLVYGSYHTGEKYHLWQRLHLPAWVHPPKFIAELLKPKLNPPPLRRHEVPLMFVNVNPAVATPEPPKDAKYYSDKNSRAANPNADKITDIPKIDGKHPELVRTEDVTRPKFTPLQPSPPPQPPKETQPPTPQPPKETKPPPVQPPKETQPPPLKPPEETKPPPLEPPKEALAEAKPKPAYTPGDLTLATPSPTPRPTEGEANEVKHERPRTVNQALAQLQQSQLPGEKTQQDGGVTRHHELASLDTKATPFGAYDAALVRAISQKWYDLLDARDYASDSRGKVVLQFRLHYDGRVTEVNMAENTAGEVLGLLCQKAVQDPAPFAAWPSDMRRTLGDIRNIQFTFYYY